MRFSEDDTGNVDVRLEIDPPLQAGEDSGAAAMAMAAAEWLTREIALTEAEGGEA